MHTSTMAEILSHNHVKLSPQILQDIWMFAKTIMRILID